MDEYNLSEIQERVNAAKHNFIGALESYRSYDGRQIIDRFLAKFQDRSEATADLERETEQLISGFNSTSASLANDIDILLMRMQSTALGLSVYVMGAGIGKMGEAVEAPPGASALDLVVGQMAKFKEAQKAFVQSGEWAKKTAYLIGVHSERVQLMAADIIRLRTLTLRGFKDENVGTSFKDLIEQIHDKQYARTGIVLLDAAFDRILEVMKELALYVAEKNPMVELWNLAKKIGKAIKGKAPDTSGGGTELMNELLSQLRRESTILQDLKNTFDDAMKELDGVDQVLRA